MTSPTSQGRCKATWEKEFKLPWREAGPPNHHDDKVDSDQAVVNKELSLPDEAMVLQRPRPPHTTTLAWALQPSTFARATFEVRCQRYPRVKSLRSSYTGLYPQKKQIIKVRRDSGGHTSISAARERSLEPFRRAAPPDVLGAISISPEIAPAEEASRPRRSARTADFKYPLTVLCVPYSLDSGSG